MIGKTHGEQLFEEYLIDRGHSIGRDYDYEPDLGKPRHPDFLLKTTTPAILFDVTDFSGENIEDQKLQATAGTGSAVRLDPLKLVRDRIHGKRAQFRPFKNDYACALVFYKSSSLVVDLDPQSLAFAALGDPTIVWSAATKKTLGMYGKNGILHAGKNTTFSAICSVEEHFPDRERAKALSVNKKLGFPAWLKQRELLCKKYDLDLEKRVVRMNVFLNSFALKQIDRSVFSGPHDLVMFIDPSSGKLTTI